MNKAEKLVVRLLHEGYDVDYIYHIVAKKFLGNKIPPEYDQAIKRAAGLYAELHRDVPKNRRQFSNEN
jgi:hypothetical protein